MPEGKIPKTRGTICNVPIDTFEISNTLPRQAESSALVIVKLKRKPETKGHVISQNLHIYNQLLQHLKITEGILFRYRN